MVVGYIVWMTTELLRRRPPDDVDDEFDIDAFKARSAPVSLEGVDLDSFRDEPLDPDSLRCLRYMHDVEYHTVCYLRDLLVTPAHRDPTITTFLTLWNLEEMYHGEAIGAVLAAHGEPAGRPRIGSTRQRLGRFDRLAPAAHTIGSLLVGQAWTAVHMTWGAVNEWTAQAAYARLGQRAGHPALSTLLGRIMRQEGRHADFYARQAERRLRVDARARWLTRTALRRWWAPGRLHALAPQRGGVPRRSPLHGSRRPGHDRAHRPPVGSAPRPGGPAPGHRRRATPDRRRRADLRGDRVAGCQPACPGADR